MWYAQKLGLDLEQNRNKTIRANLILNFSKLSISREIYKKKFYDFRNSRLMKNACIMFALIAIDSEDKPVESNQQLINSGETKTNFHCDTEILVRNAR